ncbi:MAG: SurA N-terminal domain-containing protein [Pseudohongiella sp.]|nr:SurA N-terminal domain-containing protein [Pseudohongiella sp.]
MLQSIRDNSQGVIAKIIIGFIIGLMALFGAESIVGGFLGGNDAASVNGEEITEQELAVSLQSLMASLGAGVADFDEQLLRDVALGQLIDDKLLLQAANDARMVISPASIDREIINTAQFQIGGRFDQDLARRTMAAQGFSAQTYRAAVAERMLMGQLVNAYSSTAFVTQDDIARLAALEMQSRDFRFVSVPLGTRTLGEAIPEQEIQTYYDANPERFTSEEQVSLQYVVLDKNDIFNEVEIAEELVRANYEEQRSAAVADIERRASHILLEVGSGQTEEQVVAIAAGIKQRLDSGEDFGALAREFSVDTFSAESDGDIGYTNGSVFPAAVEEALLAMEVGQVSEPVVSEFGVHVLKLTEYAAQSFPEYEEIAERISRDLKTVEVDQLFFSRMETLANLAFETFDLQAISEDLGLEIQESEFFGRIGGSGPVTSNPAVIEQAFSTDILSDELNSDVIELTESMATVVRLREHRPASIQAFDEVRAEIAVLLRTQKEQEKAQDVGQQVIAALESGSDAADILAAESLSWNERTGVRRNQFDLNTEIIQNVFSLPAPEENQVVRRGFSLTNGAYVVIELQSVNAGSPDDMPEDQRTQLAAAMLDSQGRLTFDALLGTLRDSATIR